MDATAANPSADVGGGLPENPRPGLSLGGLANTIERLANIIDLETNSLQLYRSIDLVAFNHQKSHGLLELTRAMRGVPHDSLDTETLQDLARLREKLEKNLAVLDIHLKAVRQVSALIARAIEDDNSDGTYSASINQRVRQL